MNVKKLLLSALFAAITLSGFAQAKYVFYFIGDGMGMGHVNATEYYNRFVLKNDKPLLMMQFPVTSQLLTYSLSSPVTDSAAAGTALATGYKTRNNMLAMSADTLTAYQSVARKLKNEGWGVGILTSVAPDDATPAAFYANQPSRSLYYEIGKDAIASGYDFLGGCSLRGTKDKKGNATDLNKLVEKAGIKVAYGTDNVKPVKGKSLWVLSPEGKSGNNNNIGYTIDSIPGAINLADMTRIGLAQVQKNSPEKFFMMIEGGNIDHAAHANDPGCVIKEVLNFQDAIKVAYDFYLQHPDETLIIVTADHDTGGMAIGHPNHYGHADLGIIDSQRISKDRLSDDCRARLSQENPMTWEEMQKLLTDKMGFWVRVPVTDAQTAELKDAFNEVFVKRNSGDERGLYNTFNGFVTKVFEVYNYHVGTTFVSRNHSANPVPVFAIGAGAEKFNGAHNNTDVPNIIYEITR